LLKPQSKLALYLKPEVPPFRLRVYNKASSDVNTTTEGDTYLGNKLSCLFCFSLFLHGRLISGTSGIIYSFINLNLEYDHRL